MKFLYLLFILLLSGMIGVSCSDKDDGFDDTEQFEDVINSLKCIPSSTITGEKDNIIGNWRLVMYDRGRGYGPAEKDIDYSCDSIIYHFHDDNKLIITSNVDEYQPQGEFEYQATRGIITKLTIIRKKISFNDTDWSVTITESRMLLLSDKVPQQSCYFVRVQ